MLEPGFSSSSAISTRLGLGTVQWGMIYGVANQDGIPPTKVVESILSEARSCNVRLLDTATVYGHAEEVLGANDLFGFNIVTKTPKFESKHISREHVDTLIQTFYTSLNRLSCERVYGLLIHHAEDLLSQNGEKLFEAMNMLKKQGLVEKIGVSVYDSSQVESLLERYPLEIIQLPINVFDQRLITGGQLVRLKERHVEIHARSVFLQGLLLMPLEKIPSYFKPLKPLLRDWHFLVKKRDLTLTQAALSFVRDIPQIDAVIVGVESLQQFRQCVNDFKPFCCLNYEKFACNDPQFVNPALWKLS